MKRRWMARAEAKCLDGSTIMRSEEIWAENPAGAKEAAEDCFYDLFVRGDIVFAAWGVRLVET